jgi:hypothetical protein
VTRDTGGKATGRILSGGNPQVTLGHGEAAVEAYIAAIPGWQQETVRALDALITRTVPGVRKAVKWNSPFYGVEDKLWFAQLHVYTRYVKVCFFKGEGLSPLPPVASKMAGVRYLHLAQGAPIDEPSLADWFVQAARLPGMKM